MAPRKKHPSLAGLKGREYGRAYYRINREHMLKREKEKYAENPTPKLERARQQAADIKKDPARKVKALLGVRKRDAKKRCRDFCITIDHLIITKSCPLLPREINYANDGAKANSPSIDRLDPTKGYVPGNVWIISARANRIKNDATFEEFEMIYFNWRAELIRRGLLQP